MSHYNISYCNLLACEASINLKKFPTELRLHFCVCLVAICKLRKCCGFFCLLAKPIVVVTHQVNQLYEQLANMDIL